MRAPEACKFTEKPIMAWRRWKHGCGDVLAVLARRFCGVSV